jgi:hypothetical protein
MKPYFSFLVVAMKRFMPIVIVIISYFGKPTLVMRMVTKPFILEKAGKI